MADGSKIEWTDSTWNIITGCSIKSTGCKICYAMRLAGTRLKHHPSRVGLTQPSAAGPVWTGEVRFNEQWLDQPQRWTRPREIFVCAHGDLFHENVPDAWLDQVFAVMGNTPWHRFQVLTKRSARMFEYLSAPGVGDRIDKMAVELANARAMRVLDDPPAWPLPNVLLMVSAERQQEFDERVPDLLMTPAAMRGVSLEPLLGPINLSMRTDRVEFPPGLHRVIVGGESGQDARPMHPDWPRSIRDQCAAAGVSFHFKQHGAWVEHPDPTAHDATWLDPSGFIQSPFELDGSETAIRKVGKKVAGRMLDGVLHDWEPT